MEYHWPGCLKHLVSYQPGHSLLVIRSENILTGPPHQHPPCNATAGGPDPETLNGRTQTSRLTAAKLSTANEHVPFWSAEKWMDWFGLTAVDCSRSSAAVVGLDGWLRCRLRRHRHHRMRGDVRWCNISAEASWWFWNNASTQVYLWTNGPDHLPRQCTWCLLTKTAGECSDLPAGWKIR